MMRMRLWHGRVNPDQPMEEMGFDGPVLEGIESVHVVYAHTMTVKFLDTATFDVAQDATGWEVWDEHILIVRRHDDMIEADGKFYGDYGYEAV